MAKLGIGQLLGCGLCLLLGASGPARGSEQDASAVGASGMNVLLISLDTVRADALTFRDPDVAQHMSALAARGTVFTQAISGSSWTLPTHAQMFTGMPLPLHGVDADDVRIDPLTPILPELLKRAGYRTGGVFSVRYLWDDYGFGRGFDSYRSAMAESDLERPGTGSAPRGDQALERARELRDLDPITSPRVVDLARRFLESAHPNEPIFLFAHFFDPHHDYVPPPPWDERFDPDYTGTLDGKGFLHNKRIYDPSRTPPRQIGDRDLEHIWALYRGEIAWTDRWVGELLSLFERHRRLDDTLILITADHGEEFFEHGHHFHRRGLFDEVIRVPLLIVPPRSQREGGRAQVDRQVSLTDLLPTILDFAGLEPMPEAMGSSLRPDMMGEAQPSRPALLTLYRTSDPKSGALSHEVLQGFRTEDEKLLRRTRIDAEGQTSHALAWFDLRADPGEQAPVARLDDARVRRAHDVLETELARVREHWQRLPWSPERDRLTDVRETFEEELLALGYIESAKGGDTTSRPIPIGPPAAVPLRSGGASWLGRGQVAAVLGLLLAAWVMHRVHRSRQATKKRARVVESR